VQRAGKPELVIQVGDPVMAGRAPHLVVPKAVLIHQAFAVWPDNVLAVVGLGDIVQQRRQLCHPRVSTLALTERQSQARHPVRMVVGVRSPVKGHPAGFPEAECLAEQRIDSINQLRVMHVTSLQ